MPTPAVLLARLESTKLKYGPGWSETKLALLRQLGRSRLTTSSQVLRLHEHVCSMRADPDDSDILGETEKLIAGFARRADLLWHRDRLADSGITGTDIHYRFFWPTARWLAGRWPTQLDVDWDQVDDPETLAASLPLLVTPVQATWLRVNKPPPREALARLSGRSSTDAVFLVRRVEMMPGDDFTREAFYESMGLPLVLRAGQETPSRTHAHSSPTRVYFRTSPPQGGRPDLRAELDRPPRSVRSVTRHEGARLIDLAREAMVTRGRDLDTFAYGDERDVRLIDDEGRLTWAMIGLIPERRPTLRTAYGYLILRNGVPIGYAQSDTLWRCVDVAFNTFETFRGGESAVVMVRTMAALRHLFDADSFTLEPYQLGDGNEEGIASGAWWFYYKLGFRPRKVKTRKLVKAELERMKRNPRHRSSTTTLAELAKEYLYFEVPGARAPYWPRVAAIGAQVSNLLSSEKALDGEPVDNFPTFPPASLEAIRHAGPTARAAWAAWAPIVRLMPGLEEWSDDEKHDLVRIILAKGGRRDSDYLRLFDRHPSLGDALRRLTRA